MSGDDLRALAEAANEGEWEAYELPDPGPNRWRMTGIGIVGAEMGHRAEAMFSADAAFIAAANPAAVLALLDEVERLRAAVGRVRALADEWVKRDCEWSCESEMLDDLRAALDGDS